MGDKAKPPGVTPAASLFGDAPRGELFANSDSGIRPNAPVPIPDRLSARPIAVRRRCHVYRRWSIVTWGSGRSADNGPRGETADEPSRNVAAACADWRGCSTRERQRRCHCCHEEKSFHASPDTQIIPEQRVALISNREISVARKGGRGGVMPLFMMHRFEVQPTLRPQHNHGAKYDPTRHLQLRAASPFN